ncbi:hypothetical protein BCR34DRAFT_622179 [Clohesyomyces aquaticus]|uniref:Uncharacterized protein n=1 Tax=Clohesyomyces aquaticus TaxID=1231657 RepID=A0A1Y2A3B6_9PLEO|nr:hypothetical protein BCR34DRAFT_622179 [Clohesyomyces aquaticus]
MPLRRISKRHPEREVLVDLYSALETDPSNPRIHERLLEAWIDRQDEDMALGVATDLLQLDRDNTRAKGYLASKGMGLPKNEYRLSPRARSSPPPSRMTAEKWKNVEKELEDGYTSLKSEATMLYEELTATSKNTKEEVEMLKNLKLIADGHVSSAVPMAEPLSVRETARKIMAHQSKAQDILIEDLEIVTHWMKLQVPAPDTDALRSRLVKRKTLMEAALPASLAATVSVAFATAERELLQKQYVNKFTMLLEEPISTIPRDRFLVTEDNYAWDMEELTQSLASNGGVMRNPLSRQLFSESDIRSILSHPLGKRLQQMQEAQHQLKQGFRVATLDWIEKLGSIMVQDQTEDAGPSRHAMDEFLAYAATLPQRERLAIDTLKIPASDRHTGQAYDYTVGESVGDFLSQAAPYLRRQ